MEKAFIGSACFPIYLFFIMKYCLDLNIVFINTVIGKLTLNTHNSPRAIFLMTSQRNIYH